MAYIKKTELTTLSQAIAFARDYLPAGAIWKWDKVTTWGEMLDQAHKVLWDLQVKQYETEKKQVEYITEQRKNSPEHRRKHREASRRYYAKHKKTTPKRGADVER